MSNFKVLSINNLEEILHLEEAKLQSLDEIERMTISWKAPWRREALEHYLQLGWCIGLRDEKDHILGYFLAQPILFMESYTHTLWVEHVSYAHLDMFLTLVDFAYKYGRDKHLQRVLFKADPAFDKVALSFKTQRVNQNLIEVFTTKMS